MTDICRIETIPNVDNETGLSKIGRERPDATDRPFYDHDCTLQIDGLLVFLIHDYIRRSGQYISLRELRRHIEKKMVIPNRKRRLIRAIAVNFITGEQEVICPSQELGVINSR